MTATKKSTQILVAIGSSAGGLKALQTFVASLSTTHLISYIVAQHLLPSHESSMVPLLAKHTDLNVVTAADDLQIVANTIYVCPANYNIEVDDNQIRLRPPLAHQKAIPSINFLLASVAVHYRQQSVGIILTGVGSDGAQGMKLIKSYGGVTMVHDPNHAQYNGMPNAAIAATDIDHLITPESVYSVLVDRLDKT